MPGKDSSDRTKHIHQVKIMKFQLSQTCVCMCVCCMHMLVCACVLVCARACKGKGSMLGIFTLYLTFLGMVSH